MSESKEKKVIYVKTSKVACSGENKFSNHPLIYLDLLKQNSVICPYCSTNYVKT